jgi:hypothetical protein
VFTPTVVLLAPQRAGLDVSETGHVAAPLGLQCHLDKFGILLKYLNRCVASSKETLTSIIVCTIPKKLRPSASTELLARPPTSHMTGKGHGDR